MTTASTITKEHLEQLLALLTSNPSSSTPNVSVAHTGNEIITFPCGFGISAPWIIDSGASDHMTNSLKLLKLYSPCLENKKVKIADGSFSPIAGKGSVQISENIDLKSVLYVPKLTCNLLSDRSSGKTIGNAKMVNGLYYFEDILPSKEIVKGLSSISSLSVYDQIMVWHCRLVMCGDPQRRNVLGRSKDELTIPAQASLEASGEGTLNTPVTSFSPNSHENSTLPIILESTSPTSIVPQENDPDNLDLPIAFRKASRADLQGYDFSMALTMSLLFFVKLELISTEEFSAMEFRLTLRDDGMRAAFQLLHMVLELMTHSNTGEMPKANESILLEEEAIEKNVEQGLRSHPVFFSIALGLLAEVINYRNSHLNLVLNESAIGFIGKWNHRPISQIALEVTLIITCPLFETVFHLSTGGSIGPQIIVLPKKFNQAASDEFRSSEFRPLWINKSMLVEIWVVFVGSGLVKLSRDISCIKDLTSLKEIALDNQVTSEEEAKLIERIGELMVNCLHVRGEERHIMKGKADQLKQLDKVQAAAMDTAHKVERRSCILFHPMLIKCSRGCIDN
ncbi:hypothetical protein ZIOFF_070501 [Zingiber officinale]|uniref:Retrovirus-related Pol polyprotein from transposon TNT 1-94-like beta-barrel domain-containing protein n=1 Tax=Zingiber officinale TaxID=94328 RepID=A0A8J5C8E9_ZINOF|nr:hypothetical protein ZIOFF_070501 [Zingiber officinale]